MYLNLKNKNTNVVIKGYFWKMNYLIPSTELNTFIHENVIYFVRVK